MGRKSPERRMMDRMDRTFGPSAGLYVFSDKGRDPATELWLTEVRSREGNMLTFGTSDAGRVTVVDAIPVGATGTLRPTKAS